MVHIVSIASSGQSVALKLLKIPICDPLAPDLKLERELNTLLLFELLLMLVSGTGFALFFG